MQFVIQPALIKQFNHSLRVFVETLRNWNNLDEETVRCETVEGFNEALPRRV